jgi:hypothetical protein
MVSGISKYLKGGLTRESSLAVEELDGIRRSEGASNGEYELGTHFRLSGWSK